MVGGSCIANKGRFILMFIIQTNYLRDSSVTLGNNWLAREYFKVKFVFDSQF